MRQNVDIDKALTYEIRKEMADRYFGFRRLIQDDTEELAAAIRRSLSIEERICVDVVRICLLLGDEELISEFFAIIGIEPDLFYDPYMLESETIRKRLLTGLKMHGLTRAGRFKNLIFDLYQSLVEHVDHYREKYAELIDERETIQAEIEQFYRRNDLSGIMNFLRQFDRDALPGHMAAATVSGVGEGLEEKMRIAPPPPVEAALPVLPPLPPFLRVKRQLKNLAERAMKLHLLGLVMPGDR